MNKPASISDLIGKTISGVSGLTKGSDEVQFVCSDGSSYIMRHYQDCCEHVSIEDVTGDVDDLTALVVDAREETNTDNPPENADSFLWTFYIIQTTKGAVTIRWLGESNGYYSESVSFERTF